MMKFEMPVITVSDISISRKFYEELIGLEVQYDFGANIAFRDSISLWDRERASEIVFGEPGRFGDDGEIKSVELYFESDDIEEVQDRLLENGVEFIHTIKEEAWGQRNMRFLDPDGYVIEVGEPIENVVKRLHEEGYDTDEISMKSQLPFEAVVKIISQF
ncbi:MAG: VOC family protein [Thermoplasmatota archaeon]